jgi:hypothetical protein
VFLVNLDPARKSIQVGETISGRSDMNIAKRFLMTFCILLFSSLAISQEKTTQKIQLTAPTIETTADFAVWRTDYYICTGIAYARSLGKTVDDFAEFVGSHHSWEDMRGKGLAPPVQLLYFLIKNYKDGKFEILSESDSSVTMRSNRPYASYFNDGPLLGVTVDEFESCLWKHIGIMARRIGLDFVYRVEGDQITSTLSIKK